MSGYRERYRFTARDPAAGAASLAPLLPLRLRMNGNEEVAVGLIDSGAAVSVLPWSVGARLGGDGDAAPPVTLSGNLASSEARVLVCEGLVGSFAPRRLAFAWSRSDAVPVLLGQVNFLAAFDVLLSRAGGWFEVGEPGAWGACPGTPVAMQTPRSYR